MSRFGHLSLNSAQAKMAICTWRPFIFRRPICGTHGTFLGHNPSLGISSINARGRDKKPPVSPSLRSLSFLLFPLLSLFGLQTELNQQLHTPDAQSIGQGTFCCGGNKLGLTLQRNCTPQWSSPPSRLFWAVSPPSCVSSHTSLMPPFSFFLSAVDRACLGIFTLLLLLSTVLIERAGAHRQE